MIFWEVLARVVDDEPPADCKGTLGERFTTPVGADEIATKA